MTTLVTRPETARAAASPRRRGRSPGRSGAAGLFLLPFMALFTACTLIPIGYAVYLSLFSERSSGLGFGAAETVFTGFGNYARALADPAFTSGFANVALYCALYIPVMIGSSLLLALLLDSALARARRFFQLALFLPHAVPGIIAALIWVYMYAPGISPVLDALDTVGLQVDILGHPLPAVVNMAAWQWIGYNVVIFYAALQAIPREVLEAAAVDGASPLRTALNIKVPLIRGSVMTVVMFTVIGGLQLFTEPMILQGNAPSVDSSWTPNMYVYAAAFERNDNGLAAAASVLLAVVAAGLSFLITRIARRREARAEGGLG
ncbi:carbohydrate ABC transporter permease [Actinokineospora sp. HUAS TT18]|uniref:carbohydrate ABC transporter permease n=1 Tax=Actinokineospora sp. HUAS TT18 TaxID=3447451 RepID=UPI003F528B29